MGLKLGGYIAAGLLKGVGQGMQANIDRKRAKDELAYKEKKATLIRDEQRKYDEEQDAIVRGFKQEDKAKDRAYREQQDVKQYRMQQKGRLQLRSQDFASSLKKDKIISQRKLLEENFTKDKEAGQKFEKLGKMSTTELAYLTASKVAQNYPKDEYGYILNQTLKSYNGYDKARLIGMLDGYQPDYSKYEGTEYADSIPRPTGLGGADMEGLFSYDTQQFTDLVAKQTNGMKEWQSNLKQDRDSLSSLASGEFGVEVSPAIIDSVIADTRDQDVAYTDSQGFPRNIRVDLIRSRLASNKYINYEGTMMSNEDAKDLQAIDIARQEALTRAEAQQQVTPEDADVPELLRRPDVPQEIPQGVQEEIQPIPDITDVKLQDPAVKAELNKKANKALKADVKSLGKQLNIKNTLSTYTQISDLTKFSEELPEDVWGSLTGLITSPDFVKKVQNKFGDAIAEQALQYQAKIAGIQNPLRTALFGTNQTESEIKAFKKLWGDLTFISTKEAHQNQLNIVEDMVKARVTAGSSGFSKETRKAYADLNKNLDLYDVLAIDRFDLSDLKESDRKAVQSFIDSGGDSDTVEEYLQSLRSK